MELASTQQKLIIPDLVKFSAQASAFKTYMFADSVTQSVEPVDWQISQAQGDRLHPHTVSVVKQLLTTTGSSAGVESFFIIRIGTF